MIEIVTQRTRLRRPVESDIDDLLGLDNDREVMRWVNGGVPVTREAFAKTLLPLFLSYQPDEVFGFWIAETDGFIGWVSLRGDAEEAELGFRLVKSAWGRGYAGEIAGAVIASAPQATRIVATTYEKNTNSQNALKKLGFELVRRYRLAADDMSDSSVNDGEMWDGDDIFFELKRRAVSA